MLRFEGWDLMHGDHLTHVIGANGFVMLVCMECEIQVSTEDVAAGLPFAREDPMPGPSPEGIPL